MRFRNSFHLFLNNFKSTYVMLLFRLVVFLITGSVIAALLYTGVQYLTDSVEMERLLLSLQDIPMAIFNSTSYAEFDILLRDAIEGTVTALSALMNLLGSHLAEIILSCGIIIFCYLLSGFLNGLATFAFGNILNDKMSQYADTPFFVAFLNHLGGAAIYQIVYVPLSFAYDILVMVVWYFVFFRLFGFLTIFFSLFAGMAFIVAMQALKLAVISDWMPGIVVGGKKVSQAIKESFKMGAKHFLANFSNYLIAIYCLVAVNVLFALTTFFSALIISIPASVIFLVCLQFVNYYEANNKRYFLSYTNISSVEKPVACSFCFQEEKPYEEEAVANNSQEKPSTEEVVTENSEEINE